MKKNLRCKLCGNKQKKAHEKNPKKWCIPKIKITQRVLMINQSKKDFFKVGI